METIREFIDKAVEKYNAGELTPWELSHISDTYERTFKMEHDSKCQNLRNARIMLYDTFTEQKGKKILKKLGFEWREYEREVKNPFYEK